MKALMVDLDRGSRNYREIDGDTVRKFVGGRGINTKLVFDLTDAGVDPEAGACPIVFGTGPLTGTPFPIGGRFVATSKSPLTGTIFSSACGGKMGVYLKKNGIDFLVLTGKAQEPSYLSIEGGVERVGHEDRAERAAAEADDGGRGVVHLDIGVVEVGPGAIDLLDGPHVPEQQVQLVGPAPCCAQARGC